SRIEQRIHPLDQRRSLPARPHRNIGDATLPFDVALVDDYMRRLDRGKRVEFKPEARVSGAVQAMIDKSRLVPEMTAQAFFCPSDRLLGRIEPGGQVLAMSRAGNMETEPVRGAAVTGFTTDPVGELKLAAALLRRHIVSVAIEAELLVS